jgi:ABC-type glycerol-3-phosphate transport system substrate-binding protein
MTRKKMSRSVVALALSAAIALTGCDDADPDDPGTTSPGDTTVTTVATTVGGETTTTLGEETTTSAP